MSTTNTYITSASISLQLPSVTHTVAWDHEYLVFPAIDDEDTPPTQNLNAAASEGPAVVRVDVHQIPNEAARGGYFGYAGLERLSLLLPSEQFEQFASETAKLPDLPLELSVRVDDEGDIVEVNVNGRLLEVRVISDTQELSATAPPSRTGTD